MFVQNYIMSLLVVLTAQVKLVFEW